MGRRRVDLMGLSVVAALSLALLLPAACRRPVEAERHPAARSVEALLLLVRERSTDTTALARYVRDPSLASALASASAESTVGPPIPRWRPPYVSRVEADAADVVVVWRGAGTFREWPYATLFGLRRADGRWMVVSAEVIQQRRVPKPLGR